jgi:GNAT superfamily N-acetyltransferase
MMAPIIRPINPETDFARIAELLSVEGPEPVSIEELFEEENTMLPGDIRHHLVAVAKNNQLVGYGLPKRTRGEPAGYFHLIVLVDPNFRRCGIGSILYDHLLQFVQDHSATKLFCNILEKSADCLSFAYQRGFTSRNYMFVSKIDLHTFDETRFDGLIDAVEATGIHFSSLAAEGNTLQAQQQLYEINRIASIDDPAATDDGFVSFEDYVKTIIETSWFQPEGQFMAFDGDRAVGLSAVSYFAETNSMVNMLTGVDQAYRRRKIAQSLKLLTIRHAKHIGADYILTQNDSVNAAMLAINRKLGYIRQVDLGYYGLNRELV